MPGNAPGKSCKSAPTHTPRHGMKRGLVWGICAFNVVASGVAIFVVFRPYFQPKPALHEPLLPPPTDTPSTDWKTALEQASSYPQLQQALSRVPADSEGRSWLKERIEFALNSGQIHTDAFALDRLLAEISRWGSFAAYGDPACARLKEIVEDKSKPILVRTVCLQTLAETVLRLAKAETGPAGATGSTTWRDDWKSLLSGLHTTTAGTSLQGQTLLLMEASQQQGFAQWSAEQWNEMVGSTLSTESNADESSLIAALTLGATRATHTSVREAIRAMAHDSRSEALKGAAIGALAQIGDPDDIQWLSSYSAESVKISQALWAARARLKASPQ